MRLMLATFGRLDEPEWQRLARSLHLSPGDAIEQWANPNGELRMACRSPHDTPNAVRSIVSRADCTAMVDGWIGDVDCRGAAAAAQALDAYLRWGPRFAARLMGEFAYVLHDGAANEMLVGCDAIGTRAPAWLASGSALIVASRALSIGHHPAATRRWSSRYFAHIVSGMLAAPAELTAFEDVRRVAPGSTLRFELTRAPVSSREVSRESLGEIAPPTSRRDAEEALLQAIDAASARRVGSSRLAVALSGGLDSAVIASALARGRESLDAFALVSDAGAPQLAAIAESVRGVRLHRIDAGRAHGFDETSLVLTDDPVIAGPAMQIARELLYRAVAAAGVERLFNGEGGDEVFDLASRSPRVIRRMSAPAALAYLFAPGRRRRLVENVAFASNVAVPVRRSLLSRRLRTITDSAPWVRRELTDSAPFEEVCDDLLRASECEVGAERMALVLAVMRRNYLAQSLAHAAAGIEQASPFLDSSVAGLAAALPAADDRRGKPWLRDAARHRLPESAVDRPKEESFEDALCERALTDEAAVHDALEELERCALLREMVDASALRVALRDVRGMREDVRDHAYRVLFVATWAGRVQRALEA
jgi:asparagine synthase (glutamine-hydrolysing)